MNLISSVSLTIPNLSKEKKNGKFLRVLFSVQAIDLSFSNINDIKLDILVTPSVFGKSRAKLEPKKLTFSKFEGDKTEVKFYDLYKQYDTDNLLVIQLSTCSGHQI